MDGLETSQQTTRQLWAVATAVQTWARAYPDEVAKAARRGLADDDLASESIPAQVARLIAFTDRLIRENEPQAKRLRLKLLSNALGLVDSLSHEITLAIYGLDTELDAHRRDLCETDHFGPALEWENVRRHFGLDADGRKIGEGQSVGQPDEGNAQDKTAGKGNSAGKGKSKRGAKPFRDAKKDKQIYDARQAGRAYKDIARDILGDEAKAYEVGKAIDSHRHKRRRKGE